MGTKLDAVDKQRILVLVAAYAKQWENYTAEVVDPEVDFEISLPDTDWTLVGKIDLLCRDEQGLVMVEHKTRSAASITGQWDPYYQKLSFDAQISAYHLAQFSLGEPIKKTIYDVIKKITTKPKAIPKGSEGATGTRSEILEYGTYYGTEVPQKAAETPSSQEDARLYGMRIAAEVAADPDKYFHQYSLIHRNRRQIKNTARQLIQLTRDIDRAKLDKAWYQNTSNCFSYGSTCEYFDLCLGISDPEDPEKWKPRKGSDLSGARRLSHSRATCFQSCRRKYYWRYDRKIQPVKPESTALRFGKVFHEALETFWKRRKECQKQK